MFSEQTTTIKNPLYSINFMAALSGLDFRQRSTVNHRSFGDGEKQWGLGTIEMQSSLPPLTVLRWITGFSIRALSTLHKEITTIELDRWCFLSEHDFLPDESDVRRWRSSRPVGWVFWPLASRTVLTRTHTHTHLYLSSPVWRHHFRIIISHTLRALV